MKTKRGKALATKRLRRLIHIARASRIWGRSRSLACIVFMVKPETVQQAADTGAVNHHPARHNLDAQFVQLGSPVIVIRSRNAIASELPIAVLLQTTMNHHKPKMGILNLVRGDTL